MKTALRIALVAALVVFGQAGLAADYSAFSVGEMKKLNFTAERVAVPDAVLLDEGGAERRLEEWKGKVLVVNFWATWCASCRIEMPSLDRLQGAMGDDDFEVLTVATGRNAMPAIEKFFAEAGVEHLQILRDERQKLARALGILGLPVTLILDREGHEVARMIGDAAWDGPEAKALLAALLAEGKPVATN